MEMQASRAQLLERAHEAAQTPGVYLMKDVEGGILYVGKAKNLRNRLRTYFAAAGNEHLRTEMMVGRVATFDVILTETEAEALILENTLIKRHKPKFNVRLKDDKAYPYLRILVGDAFPRVDYVRRAKADGARYFGPFPSAWAARQVAELVTERFQLRDCSDNTFRHRSRPCILYQMGKCSAPCVGKISSEDYRATIQEVVGVLEGKPSPMLEELRQEMEVAAENEEYEKAAWYRDQLRNIEVVTQTQGVLEAGSERNRDVLGLARDGGEAQGVLLKIRGGKLIAVAHFNLQNSDPALADAEIVRSFLEQYYLSRDEGDPSAMAAREVLVPVAPASEDSPTEREDPGLLERALGISVRTVDGSLDEQLLSVAQKNAQYSLEHALKRQRAHGHGVEALEQTMDKLHLPKLPQRIECYDISNISGQDAVASRVVFIDGAPDKNLYRRYKIRTVEGSNDFAMMKEVLGRRFSHVDEALPDLVVVDGGKGQLSQATTILDELNVQGVPVVGLAKARTERDFQKVEVKSSMERIFIPGRKNPVPLLPHTAAYKLLVHVRDEAHRFAVSYHRNLRSKRSLATDNQDA